MTPPKHHKEIANFLKNKMKGAASVTAYRDNTAACPIPIAEFGSGKLLFYSTIGAFDMDLNLPSGNFELAACGQLKWLPNALASSIYWLHGRNINGWPVVCEDAVKHNVKSNYRHMAFIASAYSHMVSTGQEIQWMLGEPVTDKEIGLSSGEVLEKARSVFPDWLFSQGS